MMIVYNGDRRMKVVARERRVKIAGVSAANQASKRASPEANRGTPAAL